MINSIVSITLNGQFVKDDDDLTKKLNEGDGVAIFILSGCCG